MLLRAVTTNSDGSRNEENTSFAQYTPFGEIRMKIKNEVAAEEFTPRQYLYVDFSPAE